MAFASLSDLVKSFENASGDPTKLNYAYDATHTASGLYQFTNTTWRQYASQIGVDLGLYPTAASAPASVQDQVFGQAVARNGLNDWTCPGCDAPLSNYLSANPSASNLPVFAGGTPGSTGLSPSAPGAADTTPGYGQQILNGLNTLGNTNPFDFITNPLGAVGGAVTSTQAGGNVVNSAVQGGISTVFKWLFSSRVALAVLAVLFIGGALALLAIRSGIEVETSRA